MKSGKIANLAGTNIPESMKPRIIEWPLNLYRPKTKPAPSDKSKIKIIDPPVTTNEFFI